MFIELPETCLTEIVERVKQMLGPEFSPQEQDDPEVLELRRKLKLIKEKEHISIADAALLLSCSDGHIRNLVKKAKKNQTKNSIPYVDLDGPTVFKRVSLLEWAEKSSRKIRAA